MTTRIATPNGTQTTSRTSAGLADFMPGNSVVSRHGERFTILYGPYCDRLRPDLPPKIVVEWRNGQPRTLSINSVVIDHIETGTLTTEQQAQKSRWSWAQVRYINRYRQRTAIHETRRIVAQTDVYGKTTFQSVPVQVEPEADGTGDSDFARQTSLRIDARHHWLQVETPEGITLNGITASRQGRTHLRYDFQRQRVHTHGRRQYQWERVETQHYQLDIWQYPNGWTHWKLWDVTGSGDKGLAGQDTKGDVQSIIARAFRSLETVR